MKCYVLFGLFLSITVTVQSQCESLSFGCLVDVNTYFLYIVTVTWQRETVTGLLMIFHSEIEQTVNSNSLTCRHPTGPVAWYLAVRNTRLTTGHPHATFLNIITKTGPNNACSL